MVTPLHSLPITGALMDHSEEDIPQRAHDDTDLEKGIERPPLSAHRVPTSKSSPIMRQFSKRELQNRETLAKRAQYIRVKAYKKLNQSMLKDHWPELRPASHPVYHRTMAPPPPLPRSLPILGWKKDPSHRIRHDPPKGAPFPFPHSIPGSPS